MSERCETCRFWHTQDGTFPVGQPPGRCRREHPYGTPCGSADWCGEWKAKPYGSDEGDLSLDEIRAAMRHTSFDGVMVQERPGPDGYPCRLRDRFDLPRVQDLVNGRLVRVECLTCGEMFEEGGIYPCMQPQPEPAKTAPREPGHYWVRMKSDGCTGPWFVAEWLAGKVWSYGGDVIVPSEIDERRIVRGG